MDPTPVVIAAEDDEAADRDAAIAGLVVIPGRLHLSSRYYYQDAGFPAVWKYKSALQHTRLAIAVLLPTLLLTAIVRHNTDVFFTSMRGIAHGVAEASALSALHSQWSTMDRFALLVCAASLVSLSHFFLLQLSCVKMGKLNCHLVAQIEADPRTAIAAGHCKMRSSVIAHSTRQLESASRAMTGALVVLLTALMARHSLITAYCAWLQPLSPVESRPWYQWFEGVQWMSSAVLVALLCQSVASMWNVLTEQLRQELGVEQPHWHELPHLFAQPNTRRSWQYAHTEASRGQVMRSMTAFVIQNALLMGCESSGWALAQVLCWVSTVQQVVQAHVGHLSGARLHNKLVDWHLLREEPAERPRERRR